MTCYSSHLIYLASELQDLISYHHKPSGEGIHGLVGDMPLAESGECGLGLPHSAPQIELIAKFFLNNTEETRLQNSWTFHLTSLQSSPVVNSWAILANCHTQRDVIPADTLLIYPIETKKWSSGKTASFYEDKNILLSPDTAASHPNLP